MGPAGSHPSPSVPKVGPPGRAAGWQDSGLHLETLTLAGLSFLICPGRGGMGERWPLGLGWGRPDPAEDAWATLLWSLLQPERINPELNQKGYNVKSDVWSLGITMVPPGAPLLLGRGCTRSLSFRGLGNSLALDRNVGWLHKLRRDCVIKNYGVLRGASAGALCPPWGEGQLYMFSTSLMTRPLDFTRRSWRLSRNHSQPQIK